jgi:hypothetical protein
VKKHPFRDEAGEFMLWGATVFLAMMVAFDPYRSIGERWMVALLILVACRWWVVKARKLRRRAWEERNRGVR